MADSATTTAGQDGLTLRHKVGYALGDLGGCMTFALMGSLVTRYYTNVLEIDTTVLAVILLVWNVWDAINDPLMGVLMDKVYAKNHNPKGKFRPWLLRMTPLLAISAIAFWTVPTFFHGVTMLVLLFFLKLLYEGCYTMFNIPMGSLLGAMANNDTERSTLSSARGFGSLIGNVLPTMIVPQLLERYGDTSFAFGVGATICAVIGFVCCLLHYLWTEERNLAAVEAAGSDDGINFKDIVHLFTRNRAFVALIVHGLCICFQQYVASTLSTYMFSDVLGSIGIMSLQSVLSMVLGVVTLFVSPIFTKRMGLEKMVRACLLLSALAYVSLFAYMMAFEVNAMVYLVWSSVASGFASVSIYMQWGLVATVTDYNELVTGKRAEGTIYGTFNLARRIGQTLGNSAAVLALGLIGYQAGAAAQSAGTIVGIEALNVLTPAVFVLGSWVAFRFIWNITPEIREKIDAMRAGTLAE